MLFCRKSQEKSDERVDLTECQAEQVGADKKQEEHQRHVLDAMILKLEYDFDKALISKSELKTACLQTARMRIGAISVAPCYIKTAAAFLGKGRDVRLIAQIGAPHGTDVLKVKALAVKRAILDGADELEVWVNCATIKEGNYNQFKKDIKTLMRAANHHRLRFVFDVSVLNIQELAKVCQIASQYHAEIGLWSSENIAVELSAMEIALGKNRARTPVKVYGCDDKERFTDIITIGVSSLGSKNAIALAQAMQENSQI